MMHEERMEPVEKPAVDLNDPQLYINRELSWLEFNRRVLEEAQDPQVPLMERVKFLAIFSNNMDEFFMTRVAGLWSQIDAGVTDLPPDGMTPNEQIEAIRRVGLEMMIEQRRCFHEEILPALAQYNIHIFDVKELSPALRKAVDRYFVEEIIAVLTPLGVDPGRPFPFISNLSLNLAVILEDPKKHRRFARVKIPTGVFPRFVSMREIMQYADENERDTAGLENSFVFLEDIIAANLDKLFKGMKIIESHAFRVTRDTDIEIAEEEASDLLETIETGLRQRPFGQITRVSMVDTMPEELRNQLIDYMKIPKVRVYEVPNPLGMSDLFSFYNNADAPALRYVSFVPRRPRGINSGVDLFAMIRSRDVLLHHPYDSFTPTVEFIQAAANDPDVLAIKCTLYRLGSNSPIVDALLDARENNKQVAALVELKARFDEENNISWARTLEAQGVHVIYGFPGLKTHSKVVLVVRRESGGLRRYVHLSTGNYNPTTARIYTDIGLFTCREDIADDVVQLFNRLTGFAPNVDYNTLIVAPEYLRPTLNRLIEREAEHARQGRPAHLIFKMNSLVDFKMIKRLYRASMEGVKMDLIVRGICCLRPGLPEVSDNIQVMSIVGRFLEHSRIYYFHNGGDPEIYMGSADLMPRNLDRRVETMYPIESPELRKHIFEHILLKQLGDTAKARVLQADGTYFRRRPPEGEEPFDSQQWFVNHAKSAQ